MTPEQRARLQALLAPYRSSAAPGGCIAIAQRGRTVFRDAFGMADLERGVAHMTSSRIPIGSVTKQFTCAALLLLADEGVLSLDDPIGRWIPELSTAVGRPTLTQLMTHTGGIPCPLDLAIFNGYSALPAGYPLEFLLRQDSLAYAPGSGAHYSNGGYVLLSEAIRRATGKPLDVVFGERLFEPLAMRSTGLPTPGQGLEPGTATLTVPAKAGGWTAAPRLSIELLGEGGIVSTVDDLLRWAAWLRDPRSPVTLGRLAITTTLVNGEESGYGYGVLRERWHGLEVVNHVGGLPGGNAILAQLPSEGTDVALLFNRNLDVLQLATEVFAILHDEALEPAALSPRAADFRELVGRYVAPETGFHFELCDAEGELRLSVFGGAPVPLLLRSPARSGELPFIADVGLEEMRFQMGKQLDPDQETLRICEGGDWHPADRLTGPVPTVEAFVLSAIGLFRRSDQSAELRFAMTGGALVVETRGDFGTSTCPATLLNADVVHFHDPQYLSGPVAWLRRDRDGSVTSVVVSSARTPSMVFERISE